MKKPRLSDLFLPQVLILAKNASAAYHQRAQVEDKQKYKRHCISFIYVAYVYVQNRIYVYMYSSLTIILLQ